MLPDRQVLIIDAGPVSREVLARSVALMPGFQVAGSCASVPEALVRLQSQTANLVLLKWTHRINTLTFLPRARRLRFTGPVVILASKLPTPLGAKLVRQGISAICPANQPLEQLMEVMQLALKGVTTLQERYFRAATNRKAAISNFNYRQWRVINHLMEGLSNKEISQRTQLSEATVKATLQDIYNTTGVHSRSRLVCMLLDPEVVPLGMGKSLAPMGHQERSYGAEAGERSARR